MKRLERLTALLSFLQSKRFTGVSEIEQKFDVSERTVFRDIKALQEAGVPVAFEKDRGYFIVGNHFLPPLAFTLDEAKSFIFVEQLARKYTDSETFGHFSNALEKIKNKLKNHQLEDLELLESKVGAYINPNFSNKYLRQAEQAVTHREVLEIHYSDIKGRTSERKIEPIGITFYSQNWHVIAWCQLRQDYRDFALSRIQHLRKTGKNFGDGHWSLKEYIYNLP